MQALFWQDKASAEERGKGEKEKDGGRSGGRDEKLRERFRSDCVPTSHLSFL